MFDVTGTGATASTASSDTVTLGNNSSVTINGVTDTTVPVGG